MFICKKKNRNGTTSVVVDKSSGRFLELVTIGIASEGEGTGTLECKVGLPESAEMIEMIFEKTKI